MTMYNAYQEVALRSYPDGEMFRDDQRGDTLIQFVLIELSDNEDCDSYDEAVARMNAAIADLVAVRDALLRAQT